MTPISIIEDWWKHNGTFDREQASGIDYCWDDSNDLGEYLCKTDAWWDSLTDIEKERVYEDFFDES